MPTREERRTLGRIALLKIAENTEKIPLGQWDFVIWRCGTQGCAIGHAINLPEVKATGLKLTWHSLKYNKTFPFCHVQYRPVSKGCIVYRPSEHIACALGISAADAAYLFTPRDFGGYNTTPQEVAQRIRDYVAENMNDAKPESVAEMVHA